tara:strand:+ start:474 stop:665 length:192 start_codon:yes stop_codon:yes gene_type:complete
LLGTRSEQTYPIFKGELFLGRFEKPRPKPAGPRVLLQPWKRQNRSRSHKGKENIKEARESKAI